MIFTELKNWYVISEVLPCAKMSKNPGNTKKDSPYIPNRIYDQIARFCMPFEDLVIATIVSLVIGFALGYFYIRPRITAIEERYRAELGRWKVEAAGEIRKDSVNRSRSTLKGRIAEQMAPVLPGFGFNPADARFIGSPVDYVIFDGLTEVADEKQEMIRIVFMDVKKGSAGLSRTQRIIKKTVEEKAVEWQTFWLADA